MLALGTAALMALAACGAGSASAPAASPAGSASTAAASASCKPGATKLTMWGWAAGYNLVVQAFNKTHPDICVTLNNAGATTAEYVKLGDAIKAGSGAPDVAEIEYFELPSFEITHSLVNLAGYGVNAYAKDFVPVAWNQVREGNAVYAMPVDVGPLALYYNSALLSKYRLKVPGTWAEFGTEAAALHKADPQAYMTDFAANEPQFVLAMMEQAGIFPFKWAGGRKLTINFTGPAQMAFAGYWQKLLSAHEVNAVTDFTPTQWADFQNGVDAIRISPAWGPVGMQQSIKKTIGNWRAAPMPQQRAGEQLSGNWGGSAIAVLSQSKHPKQAAEFAEWFGGTAAAWKILSGPVAGAFPGYTPLLNQPSFLASTLPISGPSHPNKVFASAAQHMVSPQWPPIMTEALTEWTSVFAGVMNGSTTLPSAFRTLQSNLVKYATAQGFQVTQ